MSKKPIKIVNELVKKLNWITNVYFGLSFEISVESNC